MSALDKLPTNQEEELARYEAINPWAVLALVLGVASVGVLLVPALIAVPILALAAAGFALYQMSDENAGQGGRWMAVLAVALALFSAGTALARDLSRAALLRSEARQVAEAWLGLLQQGDLPAAHQMTLVHSERQAPGVDLAKLYAAGTRKEELEKHFAHAPLDRIVQHAAKGQFAFEADVSIGRSEREEYIDQLWRLDWPLGFGRHESLVFRIVLERTLHPTEGHGRWRVYAVTPEAKG